MKYGDLHRRWCCRQGNGMVHARARVFWSRLFLAASTSLSLSISLSSLSLSALSLAEGDATNSLTIQRRRWLAMFFVFRRAVGEPSLRPVTVQSVRHYAAGGQHLYESVVEGMNGTDLRWEPERHSAERIPPPRPLMSPKTLTASRNKCRV